MIKLELEEKLNIRKDIDSIPLNIRLNIDRKTT